MLDNLITTQLGVLEGGTEPKLPQSKPSTLSQSIATMNMTPQNQFSPKDRSQLKNRTSEPGTLHTASLGVFYLA
jgi:hypothetical protein